MSRDELIRIIAMAVFQPNPRPDADPLCSLTSFQLDRAGKAADQVLRRYQPIRERHHAMGNLIMKVGGLVRLGRADEIPALIKETLE